MRKILQKILGDPNAKQLKKLQATVGSVNALEGGLKKLSDAKLKAKTVDFKARLKKGESLDKILPEAFAVVREASRRTLGQRHFDVQIMGGAVLHQGNIAEMRTGEGKTLVATLPVYLNALTGEGIHVVTVNDYLAQRDAGWMSEVYHFLGLSVGVITSGNQSLVYDPQFDNPEHSDPRLKHLRPADKKVAYQADILYGTNNEFGFDYLRDNMVGSADEMVQRPLNFAIVDEVDSILIDEARTPLIISSAARKSGDTYAKFAQIAKQLKSGKHYNTDEKARSVNLNDDGVSQVEKILGIDNLYDSLYVEYIFHLEQALRAEGLFRRDKDYVVREGEVIIVDEFTGRLLPGRRYSEGLHQAIEAKEGVSVLQESVTLATISFQNYFRLYKKLGGMTGTAATEAEEFQNIYNLDVISIPPNQPNARVDSSDRIYKTETAKMRAIAMDVAERHKKGQPVLIGTVSIEKNESLGKELSKVKVPHEILNAKNNEKEAEIIARAGQKGAVTLATNIAGRGTDIVLGEGVKDLGGLHVLGSERHESRRIDNQLRGRAGRQGDAGSTQFYVSLEDDLMRIFGGERIAGLMSSLGVDEDTPIENKLVSKALEGAQKRVESHNYDVRKQVLQYDDVMNRHREAIYGRRKAILSEKPLKAEIISMIRSEVEQLVASHTDPKIDELDRQELFKALNSLLVIDAKTFAKVKDKDLVDAIEDAALKEYQAREKKFGKEVMRQLERYVYLRILDRLWMEHLENMDHLRQGISLRSIGQRDPLVEYKKEAFSMFNTLITNIESEVAGTIFRVVPEANLDVSETELTLAAEGADTISTGDTKVAKKQAVRKQSKVGRNDPCPCGSGLKYKKCGLINAPEHKN